LVLETLHWDLSAVTPFCLLDLLLRRLEQHLDSPFDLPTVRRHAETFAALAATEYGLCWSANPGLTASSCLLTAVSGLRGTGPKAHERAREGNRLLRDLSQLVNADVGTLVNGVAAIERAMREAMPVEDNNNSHAKERMLPAATTAAPHAVNPASAANNASNPSSSSSSSSSPTDLVDMSVACVY